MKLTHHSEVEDDMIRPWNLRTAYARAMAEALDLQAFLSEDGEWYGIAVDDNKETNTLHLSTARYRQMCTFKDPWN